MTATLSPPLAAPGATATCRSCGNGLKHTLVDLGMSPLGTGYLRAEQLSQMEPFYPLQVLVCDQCFLVQVPRLAGGTEPMASEHTSCASSAESWLAHARRYRDRAIEEFRLTPANLVVEVGSNDGYLLQYFAERGIPVLGIDSAVDVARIANGRGIPTRIACFTQDMARALRDDGVAADLVVANNVLADVHDLNDFVAGLKMLMAPRAVMTLEFPYLMRLIADNQFDTIHHERLSYFSLLAVTHVLAQNGLTVYDVDELDTHGGSLRIFACHTEDPLRPITPRVDTLALREREAGVDGLDYYASFADRVQETKRKLLDFLIDAKRDGKHIAGYGAPRRENAFLNYCGIYRDLLECIVDPDPGTHGRFLSGNHIPIHPLEWITQERPDYVLLLTRHLESEIIPQLGYIQEWGGRCVIPLPEVHMVA
jgi:SAM-dependent methyltransferase